MGSTRAAMELVGGWDASLPTQHDLDVCWRLHRAGVRAEFVPEAVLHYRYREGASQVWHQELGYGEGEVALYRRHRAHGMPRRGPAQVLVSCARVLLAVLTAWRPGGRERVATQVGHQVGRVRGSLRYRTLFPLTRDAAQADSADSSAASRANRSTVLPASRTTRKPQIGSTTVNAAAKPHAAPWAPWRTAPPTPSRNIRVACGTWTIMVSGARSMA